MFNHVTVNAAKCPQLLLLVYFVTTSLITAVVLVVKRVRVVKRDASALRRGESDETISPALPSKDCASYNNNNCAV